MSWSERYKTSIYCKFHHFLSRAISLLYSVTYIALQIDASKKSDIFSSNGFSSVPHTPWPCAISFRSRTAYLQSRIEYNRTGGVSLHSKSLSHSHLLFIHLSFVSSILVRLHLRASVGTTMAVRTYLHIYSYKSSFIVSYSSLHRYFVIFCHFSIGMPNYRQPHFKFVISCLNSKKMSL